MARAYGYESDRVTRRRAEIDTIKDAVRKLLDESEPTSLTAVASWLNERGQLTATGRPWEVGTLHRTLTAPRLAGLQEVDGRLEPDGTDPIISPEQREELLERYSRGGVAQAEPYLLTGIVTCGLSGDLLSASRSYRTGPNGERRAARAYVCPPPTAVNERRRGCGRIRQLAEPLEDYVAAAVLARLSTPESAAAVAAAIERAEQAKAQVETEIGDMRTKLGELAREFAYSGIPAAELRQVREDLTRRIREKEKLLRSVALLDGAPIFDQARLTAAARGSQVTAGTADSQTLADWWNAATVPRRRALVSLLVKEITVGPVKARGARGFDEGRVAITWR